MKEESTDNKKSKNKMQDKIKEYEEKIAEYLAGWQRAKADYHNLKKESAREKQELADFIRVDVLTQIFPIIDHFEIALQHVPEDYKKESWYQGFEHLYNQIKKVLADFSVVRIETEGKDFDVQFMEAIKREKKPGVKSGKVIKEVSAGYTMNGKVIRPAKVIVAE